MARNSIYPPSITPGIPQLGKKPEGWIETTFGKVLKPIYRKAELRDDEEYQLVIARRNRSGIVPRSVLKGREVKTKTQFYLRENDFLIAKRQIIHGACGIVPAELDGAIVSNEYVALSVKNGLLLDYLRHYCHSVHFQQTCFQSSIGVDVEKMVFKQDQWFKWRLYLPPLAEQRAIAAILSTWDAAITLTDRLIAALQARKRGLMQRLLTGEVRFPEFEDKWQRLEFGQFVTRNGKHFDPQSDDDVPCIELEHISQESGQILGYVSTREQKSTKNRFSAGQVLFGKLRPYLKKYAQPDFDGVCSSEIWVLQANDDVCSNDFLFYLIQSDRFVSAANVTSGTKMPRSDWNFVSDTTFRLPYPAEQEKIVDVLRASDQEIAILERIRQELSLEKTGLMQRLLTGEIRVQVDD